MQELEFAEAAPVAAVERLASPQVEGPGDRSPILLSKHEHDAVRHRSADAIEEGARQIGPAPLAVAGVHIEGEEGVPVPRPEVAAAERTDRQAVGERLAPFLADGLALA